ncbi:von Willebrand factor A domain-containing protein 5A-like [Phyllopteryx taeniolatus]|uniref:von Willebrand factor A domain-containing protein 5A-like n=1 Tax=Phyllopteryx taeniolatus TaxID=161469 RepID=UPI002AD462B0|nr:von Willebrand factor A domain-containing protein 5A-like [Phyllopteryx taeniolatus]XP_061639334.1 von Willebrand factor A domain-containing protein 5A-like [Phyllopteryx taeniolatus]
MERCCGLLTAKEEPGLQSGLQVFPGTPAVPQQGANPGGLKLAAGHKFDRDVELLIYYKDAHQPTAVVEAGMASTKHGTLMGDAVVMLSLYPAFPQAVMSSGESLCSYWTDLEVWIVLSMNLISVRLASAVAGKSVEYSETTREDVLKKVEHMGADLGGTEILQSLKNIYSQPCIPGQPRHVMLVYF